MRLLNIVSALTGLMAFGMLAIGAHAMSGDAAAVERIKLAAIVQIGAAAAGLAIANRQGRLNAIAGFLIVGGAAIFTIAVDAIAFTDNMAFAAPAPIGGLTLLTGWLVLAFAKPAT